MSPYQTDHRAADVAPPAALPLLIRKAFDNPAYAGSRAGFAFTIANQGDATLLATLTTGDDGMTSAFPAIDGRAYCLTETVDPTPARVAAGDLLCFTAANGQPVVTFTDHVLPATVHGSKVDDRGVPVSGAQLRLACDSGVAATTASAADGSWEFDIPTSSGPLPASCTVVEDVAPAGMTTPPSAVAAFSVDAGDHVDLTSQPVVNGWERQFASMTSTPIAAPGASVREEAFGRNLSPGEVVTVTGRAYWLDAGAQVPPQPPAAATVTFGPWTLIGAGAGEVVGGFGWTVPGDRACGGYQVVLTFTDPAGTTITSEGWANPDQHIAVPCIHTESAKVVVAGDPLRDQGAVAGLPDASPRATVRARVELALLRHRGDCVDPTAVGSGSVVVPADGSFQSDSLATAQADDTSAGAWYTFDDRLEVTVERPNAPAGWTTTLPGTIGASTTYTSVTATPACDPDETVVVAGASSTLTLAGPSDAAPAGTITDGVRFFGLPTGTADHPVEVGGDDVTWGTWRFHASLGVALHRWPAGAPPDCSGSPLATADAQVLRANGDLGNLLAHQLSDDDAAMELGYVITVTEAVTDLNDGSTQQVVLQGACGDPTETTSVAALPPPSSSAPAPSGSVTPSSLPAPVPSVAPAAAQLAPPPVTSSAVASSSPPATAPAPAVPAVPGPALPRTGGVANLVAYLGTAFVVAGVGLVGTVRRRANARRR